MPRPFVVRKCPLCETNHAGGGRPARSFVDSIGSGFGNVGIYTLVPYRAFGHYVAAPFDSSICIGSVFPVFNQLRHGFGQFYIGG